MQIQDRWDSTLYEVIEIPYPDMAVFKIQPQGDPEAKLRILHRNLLQPIRQIETSKAEDPKVSCPQIKKTWMTVISMIFPSRKVMRTQR